MCNQWDHIASLGKQARRNFGYSIGKTIKMMSSTPFTLKCQNSQNHLHNRQRPLEKFFFNVSRCYWAFVSAFPSERFLQLMWFSADSHLRPRDNAWWCQNVTSSERHRADQFSWSATPWCNDVMIVSSMTCIDTERRFSCFMRHLRYLPY